MTDLEKAAAALAELFVERQDRPLTVAEKQAAPEDWLHGLGQQFQQNPVLGKALLGGGLGALAGGAAGMFGNDDGDPRGRGRRTLSHALMGGLSGAALGGGIGAFQKYRGDGKPPPAPRTLKNTPFAKLTTEERAKHIEELRGLSQPSARERAADTASHGLDLMRENMPATLYGTPAIMAGDAALTARSRMGFGNSPADLKAGLGEKALPAHLKGETAEALSTMLQSSGDTRAAVNRARYLPVHKIPLLGRLFGGDPGPIPGLNPKNAPGPGSADKIVSIQQLPATKSRGALDVPITRGHLQDVAAAGSSARGAGGLGRFGALGRLGAYTAPLWVDAARYLSIGAQEDAARRQASLDKLKALGVGG